MTYYNDQPDMYDAYMDAEDEQDRREWWEEQDYLAARDAWQNEQDRDHDHEDLVDESDVDRPDDLIVVAANGHVYWTSPPRDAE